MAQGARRRSTTKLTTGKAKEKGVVKEMESGTLVTK
jgi:hypothetical protein